LRLAIYLSTMKLRVAVAFGAASLTSYLAVPVAAFASTSLAPSTHGVCYPSSAPVIVNRPQPTTSVATPTEPIVGVPLPVAAPGPLLPTPIATVAPLSESQQPPSKPEAGQPGGQLPFTGLDVGLLAAAGALLVVCGVVIVTASTRRPRRRH
jgi:hypothetical protein